ncbi:hypothetical protein [Shewanella marina]|uniref:hypothetical protein n=1 Tax=Shewanella marina TaxID=487319 RepID=UPI00046EE0D6|nr:hypothetical protein [Shewanella marina]
MRFIIKIILLINSLIIISVTNASTWELAWKTNNLPNPESVVYDSTRNILFISNQAYAGKNGEASIGQLTLNGAVIATNWVTGLDEPKGIAIAGDTLYVSDKTFLVKIDIPSGKIIKRYIGKGAKALNDVAIDPHGNVYVSDMFNSAIYKLDTKDNFELWLDSPKLENPNGLLIEGNDIYISAWGSFNDENPLEAPYGNLLKVSLKDKQIKKITKQALGNLDGIQRYKKDFLLSDWKAGKIFTITPSGKVTEIIKTERSAGDIEYLKQQDMIIIPMALQGEILAYHATDVKRPLGVRRNGSYYSRLEWTNATLPTPLYWAANLNDDDTARNGGSWGAPTNGPAEAVLSFFGEKQIIKRVRIFHNVGATISPLDELAKEINIFVSDDSNLQRIGDEKADITKFKWQKIVNAEMKQQEGWFEFTLKKPVNARYVRIQLVENFGTPVERPYVETNEILFYPK